MNYLMKSMTNFPSNIQIIILAAGNGTRMQSNLPKVMHKIGGKSMLERVFSSAKKVTDDIILIHSKTLVKHLEPYNNQCKFALQEEPQGTAHALHIAWDLLDHNKTAVVLYADNPLITSNLIIQLYSYLKETISAIVTIAFEKENPSQYGRIITDEKGNFLKIVEYQDASPEEKKNKLCNSGIIAFAPQILKNYLPYCMKSTKDIKEFYLTKIIEICVSKNEKVSYFISQNADLVIGVNTKEELIEAGNIFKIHNDAL